MDKDSSVVTARGRGEEEEGMGGQMVMDRDLTWGGEHSVYR